MTDGLIPFLTGKVNIVGYAPPHPRIAPAFQRPNEKRPSRRDRAAGGWLPCHSR